MLKRLLVLCIFLLGMEHTYADSLVNKVYRVDSYTKNELNNTYEQTSYGSAVLVGKNQIVTNAHVVLDRDGKPSWNYNLCISEDFSKKPKCNIVLRLVKYDEDNDLALMEPVNTNETTLDNPVSFSQNEPNIGDGVVVYGYPGNGGSTITYTEGKISGKESIYYKIDANIDSGNSGGGAFDTNGKLLWIPFIARSGLTTLGYIIPISAVQQFLRSSEVTTYGIVNKDFIKHISVINNIRLASKVQTKYFEIDASKIKKYGFELRGVDRTIDGSLIDYWICSIKYGTSTCMRIYNSFVFGGDTNTDVLKKYFEKSYDHVKIKKNLKLGNKSIRWLIMLSGVKQSGASDAQKKENSKKMSIIIEAKEGLYFSIDTSDYIKESKQISNAIKLFLTIDLSEWNLKISEAKQNFGIYSLEFNNQMQYAVNFSRDSQALDRIFSFMNQEGFGTINVWRVDLDMEGMESIELSKIMENLDKKFGNSENIEINEIQKNKNNVAWRFKKEALAGYTAYSAHAIYLTSDNKLEQLVIYYFTKEDNDIERESFVRFIDTVTVDSQAKSLKTTNTKNTRTSQELKS